ncbi:hypothetical protein CYMTET_27163 [Cymbomonas tetramitiformis]|uniref:Uncharacterized protein n=1 Tax=Cymbomonas tetramitiformis TaxID=36881 RepID=A0AAE0FR14_9CHLO|nr:hypothetical protein CYMTET_27163 [Cymbomonas tetramitiformis]
MPASRLSARGASGPLDDMVAKKQLLAFLDTVFYDTVLTPLRLEVELAKVDLEDIYAHVLEVWGNEHGVSGRPKQTAAPTPTPTTMLYSGGPDVQRLIHEFEKQLEGATSTLVVLKVSFEERDEPLSGFADSRRHRQQTDGKRGVSFPPSRWRDERNRTDDGKFHGRNTREGRYGKQLGRFAAKPLHDRGIWRQEHYKKDSAHSISFHVASNAVVPEFARCPPGHYHATANCPTDDMACEERQFKQAVGGAREVQHFPMLHFDSATTVEDDAVKHDAVGIAESETGEIGMPFAK